VSGLTTRSWKGRQFDVLSLEGMSTENINELAVLYFPWEYTREQQFWAYVNYAGLRMRFSEELIKAMICSQLSCDMRDNLG
jgi:hypothetical protein